MKKTYSSIILIILGGLIIKTQIGIGDGCSGFADTIIFLFLSGVYLLTLLILMAISVVRNVSQKAPVNFVPLLTTLIIIAGYFAIRFFSSDRFSSPTKIYAVMENNGFREHRLTLKQDGSFVIQMREIEWSCYYKGDYRIINDTILLNRKVQSLTDSLFSDKYLIEETGKYLLPLDRQDKTQDMTRWLTISSPEE